MDDGGMELHQACALDNAKMLVLLLDREVLGEQEWLQCVLLAQACAQFARAEHLEAIKARMPGVFELPFRGGEA